MARQPYRTVHTSDIVAHLFYAACDTTSVVVTTSDGDFGGVLLEPSRAEVAVEVHGRAPELARGNDLAVLEHAIDDQLGRAPKRHIPALASLLQAQRLHGWDRWRVRAAELIRMEARRRRQQLEPAAPTS